MQEYVSEAIILKKTALGDLDGRYVFFTERFGKIIGKTKSSRKITSKLAPHLEPGNVVRIRYIEKKGTQIVDALKTSRLPIFLVDLSFLAQILPEGEPEKDLWKMFSEGEFSWTNTLRILGWDPEEAECAMCDAKNPLYFYIPRQEFFCKTCSSKLKEDALIYVGTD